MYFRAKYIISRGMTPIIFPETISHGEMSQMVGGPKDITGAGFVSVSADGSYQCYGESVTLRIKSNDEADSKILNKYLGGKQEDDF